MDQNLPDRLSLLDPSLSGLLLFSSVSAGFRRSLRLCRRRFYSTTQLSGQGRCPSNCGTLNFPYEEVVRYQRQPQDAHRLVALLGRNTRSKNGQLGCSHLG